MDVPPEWTPKQALDILYESLQEFPDAVEIVRKTRCVQIRFPFMHMDVTVMDPQKGVRIERAGEIFHSPDKNSRRNDGEKRVPANPYGFNQWFRENVSSPEHLFETALAKRRAQNGVDRLSRLLVEAAEQDDLPEVIPPRIDSIQVVALKLMKRYLNVRYEHRDVNRPPSIYYTKLAVDVDASAYGLTAQLAALAHHIQEELEGHIARNSKPDERNPSYHDDKLNDRWPQTQKDMEIFAADMTHLLAAIERARQSDFKDIADIVGDLFGEKIRKRSVDALLERVNTEGSQQTRYEKGSGLVALASAFAAPAIAKSFETEPRHHFHCEKAKKK